MSRTVYAVDPGGEVVAFQPVATVAGWTDASDDAICRTAQGVFLGLGLLRPQDLVQMRFVVRSDRSNGNGVGAGYVADRAQPEHVIAPVSGGADQKSVERL